MNICHISFIIFYRPLFFFFYWVGDRLCLQIIANTKMRMHYAALFLLKLKHMSHNTIFKKHAF
jgi:hypothetical protein